ncbi:unnamed protein product [Merluccius merluccius]
MRALDIASGSSMNRYNKVNETLRGLELAEGGISIRGERGGLCCGPADGWNPSTTSPPWTPPLGPVKMVLLVVFMMS